jgi:hypothetical protein
MGSLARRDVLAAAAGGTIGAVFAQAATAQTFAGIQVDRRVALAFQVDPAALQGMLQTPWQQSAPDRGPLRGANLQVRLIDRIRDDAADGKPRTSV